MEMSVHVDGLDKVVKKLRKVEQRVSIDVIRGALKFGMKPAIDKAKQLVPVDTSEDADEHALRDFIKVKVERKKNRAGNATVMRFGAQRQTNDDGSGYAIKGGLGKSVRAPNYAQLIEKRTPFLLPAIEQTQGEVVRRFGKKLMESVNKL